MITTHVAVSYYY